MSEIAKQIDPKTKAILIACIVVTLVLSVIGFLACAAKFGLFEKKSNDRQEGQNYSTPGVVANNHTIYRKQNIVIEQNTNAHYGNKFNRNLNLYQSTTTTQRPKNSQSNDNNELPPPTYSKLFPNDETTNQQQTDNDETQVLGELANWSDPTVDQYNNYGGTNPNNQTNKPLEFTK